MKGQVNLVANPSFEDTVHCPNYSGGMVIPSSCKNWYDPNGSSSDYYNSCASIIGGVPNNSFGWQYAKSGIAYAGFATYGGKEYIQEKLDSVLYQNHKYCVEFYISLANHEKIAANNIGLFICDTLPLSPPQTTVYINCIPQINDSIPITDTAGWTKISGEYIAHGGEQYITLGNFYSDAQTDTIHLSNQNFGLVSYYYIDDVSIIDCTSVGISEINNPNSEILISPNPTTGIFTIHTEGAAIKEIKITNVLGETISNYELRITNETTVDISGVAKGVYFVQITVDSAGSPTNKNVVNRKIIRN